MHLDRRSIIVFAVVALLVCYAPILRGMADQWRTDEDMGHGFAVPFVIGWIVWRERGHWRGLAASPTPWGLLVLALGAAFHVISAVGAGLFAGSLGFVFSIMGLVLVIGGFPYLRVWAFPFLLCAFMLPKLAVVYNMSTLPLQLAATRLAEGMLTLGGLAVTREGNILGAGTLRVAVVEACNGIRYLLPLGFVGVIFAYLTDPKPWMRAALLLAAVPLAILANAWRVGLAVVAGLRSPKLAEEPYHLLLGWLIFVLCLGGMRVVQWVINKVYARARS